MIENKVAIITGAARGIGRATALRLAAQGVAVVANYKSSAAAAEELCSQIQAAGGVCRLVKGDIADIAVIQAVVNTTLEHFGAIHFLINNAGSYNRRGLEEITPDDFEEKMSVNFSAPFALCQRVAPVMRRQKYGKIVNISSVVAIRGGSYSAHYASAKAALIGLTKSLARELAPDITVNCVVPGMIETSILKQDDAERRRRRIEAIPLGRLGQPADVAGVITFLLSPDADYITGEVINVSGGFYI